MNNAVEKYPHAKLLLSFDFSHCAEGRQNQKKMLLCDWTIEYEIAEHQHRNPNKREKVNIKRQNGVLSKADYIVTLFPNVYDFLKTKYSSCRYFGNGINCAGYDVENIEESHYKSNRVLFIGRPRYKEALDTLIKAVEKFNSVEAKSMVIDVIGIEELNNTPPFVKYHGFLNKGIKEEADKYRLLMQGANVFVNVNDDWIGAQSLMEAMFYRLPVIINPNKDIYKIYGESIDFGWYCANDDVALCKCLKELKSLKFDEYKAIADNSFMKIEGNTWGAFADKLLSAIKQDMQEVNHEFERV